MSEETKALTKERDRMRDALQDIILFVDPSSRDLIGSGVVRRANEALNGVAPTGSAREAVTAPARIWVREWDDRHYTVTFYEDKTDGARAYDCRACLDATGGVCLDHVDPDDRSS